MRPSRLSTNAVLLLAASAWLAAACGGKSGPETGPDVSAETPGVRPEGRPAPETPGRWYWAYVANRESDVVSRVRFGPKGAVYEKPVEVGVMPGESDGPVTVRISPDGDHWYLGTAPASPVASLFKYETGTDRRVAGVRVGASPSAVDLTPDGAEAWISGAGDRSRGDGDGPGLSVVRTDSLGEVARIRVPCTRPRSGRVARSGDRVWVSCTADDLLVEIDAGDRRVLRGLRLTPGAVATVPGDRLPAADGAAGGGGNGAVCRPADLVAGEDRIWVACPGSDEVVEVDAGDLEVRRRYPVGAGPTSLAWAPDAGLVVATNRADGTVSVLDVGEGREVARLGTSRSRPGGVAVSDDGRYAFVSNTSGGSLRSTVDVFDLRAMVRVAEVEVEHGAAGIAFWRSLPVRR